MQRGNACPRCRTAVPRGGKFCPRCGLSANEAQEIIDSKPEEKKEEEKEKTRIPKAVRGVSGCLMAAVAAGLGAILSVMELQPLGGILIVAGIVWAFVCSRLEF
ncbi:MAG: hypothetical protein ACYTAF_15770 [Planctomycetota bacterium]|jgi:hypothetical protein